MSGGRASRQKGNRTERALVRVLQEYGFAAERVPLSGAARGRFGGDVSVPLLGVDRRVEVKARAPTASVKSTNGSTVPTFLSCAPLVVLPVRLAVEIAR
jgi:Holliday junction resolvase